MKSEVIVLEEVKHIADNLRNNFMFQASLGSKELFHSNMLAWLLQQKDKNDKWYIFEKFLEIVLEKEKMSIEGLRVERETEKLDIIIKYLLREDDKYKCKLIIIENKFKSLPDLQQLTDYNAKIDEIKKEEEELKTWSDQERPDSLAEIVIKRGLDEKILLTPRTPTLDIKAINSWISKTYENNIKNLLTDISDKEYFNSDIPLVLSKYKEFLEGILEILEVYTINDKSVYNYYDKNNVSMEYLKRIRIKDLVLKIIHNQISDLIKEKLKSFVCKNSKKEDWEERDIIITAGYTNESGISDIKIVIEKPYLVGIQLQGDQLRYYVESTEKKINIQFAKNIVEKKNLWFIDITKKKSPELLSGNGRKEDFKIVINDEKIKFNSYLDNFVYLYKRLDKELKVSNLIDEMVKIVTYVQENIEDFKGCIP